MSRPKQAKPNIEILRPTLSGSSGMERFVFEEPTYSNLSIERRTRSASSAAEDDERSHSRKSKKKPMPSPKPYQTVNLAKATKAGNQNSCENSSGLLQDTTQNGICSSITSGTSIEEDSEEPLYDDVCVNNNVATVSICKEQSLVLTGGQDDENSFKIGPRSCCSLYAPDSFEDSTIEVDVLKTDETNESLYSNAESVTTHCQPTIKNTFEVNINEEGTRTGSDPVDEQISGETVEEPLYGDVKRPPFKSRQRNQVTGGSTRNVNMLNIAPERNNVQVSEEKDNNTDYKEAEMVCCECLGEKEITEPHLCEAAVPVQCSRLNESEKQHPSVTSEEICDEPRTIHDEEEDVYEDVVPGPNERSISRAVDEPIYDEACPVITSFSTKIKKPTGKKKKVPTATLR